MIFYSKMLRRNLQSFDAPMKTYAMAQSRGTMTLRELAEHMAEHNSPFSRGTINGVLEDFAKCVAHLLCDGWIIDMGALGKMYIVVKSRGVVESEIDPKTGEKPVFSAADITSVKPKFAPGEDLQNLRQKVSLHEVLTLREQVAAKRAKDENHANGVIPDGGGEGRTPRTTDKEGHRER